MKRSQYYLIGASDETVKENFELSLVSTKSTFPNLDIPIVSSSKIVDSIAHVHNNKALQFLTPNRKLYFSFQRQMYHCQSDLLLPKVKEDSFYNVQNFISKNIFLAQKSSRTKEIFKST